MAGMVGRLGVFVLATAGLTAVSTSVAAGPLCTTTKVIAIPTGMGASLPDIDKDGDAQRIEACRTA